MTVGLSMLAIVQLLAQLHDDQWKLLAPIPDSLGFAGSYAGRLGSGVVYAGGAQFAGGIAPWQGGRKVWSDKIYYLPRKDGAWVQLGHLPRALGYGASASYKGDFFLAGGSDSASHYRQTYRLSLAGGKLTVQQLAELPIPLANAAFAQNENYWYILGGQLGPLSSSASNRVFRLDLSAPSKGWQELPPLPGDGRILAAAAATRNSIYIFSGASLENGQRSYLTDGYTFTGNSWKKTAALPQPITATANPGIATGDNELLFFSGDDGSLAALDLKDKHPGFSRNVWSYLIKQDKWTIRDTIPNASPGRVNAPSAAIAAPVTTTAVRWEESILIPGGESRPAVRSNQVLLYNP